MARWSSGLRRRSLKPETRVRLPGELPFRRNYCLLLPSTKSLISFCSRSFGKKRVWGYRCEFGWATSQEMCGHSTALWRPQCVKLRKQFSHWPVSIAPELVSTQASSVRRVDYVNVCKDSDADTPGGYLPYRVRQWVHEVILPRPPP